MVCCNDNCIVTNLLTDLILTVKDVHLSENVSKTEAYLMGVVLGYHNPLFDVPDFYSLIIGCARTKALFSMVRTENKA